MKKPSKTILLSLLLVLFVAVIGSGSVPVWAKDLPSILRLGTMPVGTTNNTAGIGLGEIISKNTPMDVKVVPVAVPIVWIPMMESGEIDLGIGNQVESEKAWLAIDAYKIATKRAGVKSFRVRLVALGAPLCIGIMVRGDAPYQRISDLGGAKIPLYPKGSSLHEQVLALLALGGLTAKDIVNVPISNPLEGTRALVDGRIEAVMVAVDAPMIMEAITKRNGRFLLPDTDPEAVGRMQKLNRQYFLETPNHVGPNVMKTPIPMLAVHTHLVASPDLSEEAVYLITKAVWENRAKLSQNPVLKRWRPDSFIVPSKMFVPYHKGAVKYWKEAGIWTEEMTKIQNELMAKDPR
jgi:TRAP transporter TAXI family solute receptor